MAESKSQEEGKCPTCGSELLNYEGTVLDGNQMGYNFSCNDCGISGIEWYTLIYSETILKEEDEVL